ncbi:MAG: hypothetical protein GY719_00540 [bacterium]|nr:hypothetical protein [bacterium]
MRRCIAWLLMTLMLPAAATASGRYDRLYRSGRQAVKDGYYRTAVFRLLEAIEKRAEAGEPWVEIYGRRRVPYLPYYYLGRAAFGLGDYEKALAAWEESEKQGAVRSTEEWQRLVEYRDQVFKLILPREYETAGRELAAVELATTELESVLEELRSRGIPSGDLAALTGRLRNQLLPSAKGLLDDARQTLFGGEKEQSLKQMEIACDAVTRARDAALRYSSQAREALQGAGDREGMPAKSPYDGRYALLVGTSGYGDHNKGWRTLPGVLDDIESLELVLRGKGFEVRKVFDPRKRDFEREIQAFIKDHGKNKDGRQNRNLLLIYFSGHGETLKKSFLDAGDFKAGFLVPVDAPLKSSPRFEEQAVSMDEVASWARQIESLHAVFIFDSCFSGAIFNAIYRSSGELDPVVAEKVRQPARLFIASGNEDQEVADTSEFRRLFVDALVGRSFADYTRNGFLEGRELCIFLENSVYRATDEQQLPQCGRMPSPFNKGDVAFVVPRETH